MSLTNLQLMAHLFRRAGFGATRNELEKAVVKGYEATVEDLLHPEAAPPVEEDVLQRYYLDAKESFQLDGAQTSWVYRLINTQRPLEEKMALFWHGLFATGFNKCDDPRVITQQVEMFRRHGLGNFRELLVELSRDPAMIFWLDNCESTGVAPNENYGRELLELFSMGIGNYLEDDVKAAARAFTGWTLAPTLPRQPYGRFDWHFEYRPELHDDSEKTFLGETGRWNGEDIVNIIVKQPASARFIARHLYNQPGLSSRRATRKPLRPWLLPSVNRTTTCARSYAPSSCRISSAPRGLISPRSRAPWSTSSAPCGW